ncbi:cupin-like domain-containing protein [Streptosporangium subroseum]|uniref:cupin-like domain-containing protein n=1 Tax=Streptosporangium subroseum TaxID=106412 RepID=UPI00341689BC
MTELPAFSFAGPVERRPAGELGSLAAGSPALKEPVVLTDGPRLMEEVWRWTPEFLREAVGGERLRATLPGPDGKFQYEPGRALDSQPISVSRFFDDMADPDGPRWCLQQVAVERELPELAARLDYPAGVPRELINAVNLWMAAPGTVTPLHYDDTHNLFAQVSGSKTFYLFPPESLDALYPGPLNTGAQHLSRVDLFDPDLTRHPLAGRLSYRKATVNAGEALLLPAFWWHQVASQDVSVSVNFWWRAHVMDCLCPGFMRQLLSTAVQEDLGALTHTFELGGEDGKDSLFDAADLAQLLGDIGEYRAATALSMSILRTAERTPETSQRAGELLRAHADLAGALGREGHPPPEPVIRLVDDVMAVTSSRGGRS